MKKILLHIILPILLGGMIYVLFKSHDLLMFRWFEFFKIDKFVLSMREFTLQHRKYIPENVLYSLPDCLWVYSFTMFVSCYFTNRFILLIPCLGSVLTEVGQLWFIPGTFDIFDVIYMILFTILAFYFINKKEKNCLKQKN